MATSILIVNYKAYDDLAGCLASLVPTLDPADAVVVVDNESDETQLSPVRARYPRPEFAAGAANLGFAAGMNLAARHATGEYLLILNPDTHVAGPVVGTLAAWMDAHPEVGVAGPRIENADGTVQPSARRFPGLTTVLGGRSTWFTQRFPNNWFTRRNLVARQARDVMDVDWVTGACMMTRRDLFERLGGFDERFFMYWEDADYCRRAVSAGYRIAFVPSVTVVHTVGRSAQYDLARAIRAFHQSAFKLFWKHAGALGRVAAPLVWLGLTLRGELRVWQERSIRKRQIE